MLKRVVIVGAGHGGLQIAVSLREERFQGEIILISMESVLPYQRPPLSKAFLKSGDEAALRLRHPQFYLDNRIELLLGTFVEGIDRFAQTLRVGGSTIAYDHLILATGTRNSVPPIDGIEQALSLRSLEDARRLRGVLARTRHCAVIGGGFIGLEFAAVASAIGCKVTVAEAAPRLMARAISIEMSRRFKVKHEGSGTCILTQAHSVAVHKDALSLNDGTDIPADLILLAAGVRPNIELAEAAGLECNNGIVVNSRFQTCDPAISAIGDCASFPDPRSGKRVRLESVQGATDQARAVARRLTRDHSDDYCAVPWFWSDQADWKLQIAGLAEPSDDSHLREDGAVFRFRDGQLTAVETVNDARTHMTARRLLARTRPPSRQQLVDAAFDLGAEVR